MSYLPVEAHVQKSVSLQKVFSLMRVDSVVISGKWMAIEAIEKRESVET